MNLKISEGSVTSYDYELYGSLVYGACSPNSDIDIYIYYEPQTPEVIEDLSKFIKSQINTEIDVSLKYHGRPKNNLLEAESGELQAYKALIDPSLINLANDFFK